VRDALLFDAARVSFQTRHSTAECLTSRGSMIKSVNELDARRSNFTRNRVLSNKYEQTIIRIASRAVALGKIGTSDHATSREQAARGSKEMGKERTEIEAIPKLIIIGTLGMFGAGRK